MTNLVKGIRITPADKATVEKLLKERKKLSLRELVNLTSLSKPAICFVLFELERNGKIKDDYRICIEQVYVYTDDDNEKRNN